MTYRTILVGTDGSASADTAVAEAAGLAGATGARLVVASAYRPLPEATRTRLEDEAPAELQWVAGDSVQAEELVRRGREIAVAVGVDAQGRIEENDRPGDALLDLAGDVGADLIVVGNKGMTGAKRFLVGSVPNYIAHHADCDVLIVHTVG